MKISRQWLEALMLTRSSSSSIQNFTCPPWGVLPWGALPRECLWYELVGGFPFGEERSASLLCLIVDPPPVQPRLPSFLSVSFFPLSPFNPVWYPLPCPCMLCKFSRTVSFFDWLRIPWVSVVMAWWRGWLDRT